MEYRLFGRTGLMVSELCLGCMTFGREIAEEQSSVMLHRFLDAGETLSTRQMSIQVSCRRKLQAAPYAVYAMMSS